LIWARQLAPTGSPARTLGRLVGDVADELGSAKAERSGGFRPPEFLVG
jgi:hypothetical protein